jgi:hypothetical protein
VEDRAAAAGGCVRGEGVVQQELRETLPTCLRYDGQPADVAAVVGADEVIVALGNRNSLSVELDRDEL